MQTRKFHMFVLTALALAGTLYGCAPGKRPFLIAQICLAGSQDLSDFTRELQSIAQAERGRFIDTSADTKRGLGTVGYASAERTKGSPVVNMGIDLGHGVGVTVSNLGLPGFQVALGFSEGSKPREAHRFAEAVIRKLEARWRVQTVPNPAESGALPMPGCN